MQNVKIHAKNHVITSIDNFKINMLAKIETHISYSRIKDMRFDLL